MILSRLTEAQIELQCLDYLVRVKKLMAWKQPTTGFYDTKRKRFRKQMNPYARNGVPDILCVIEGRLIGFEVKKKGSYQTESQKLFESDLRASGGLYYVVRSLEELQLALEDINHKVSVQ